MSNFFPRSERRSITEALADTRGVFVLGARQVGKSTLAEQIAADEFPAQLINLDNKVAREAALNDPIGFVEGLQRPVFIDEVQRGGEDLLFAIKASMDRDKSPGQFLLSGSTNIFRNAKVTDALTGRLEIIHLWPLSQSEIERSDHNCVDWMFDSNPPQIAGAPIGRDALKGRIAPGGYPEARLRNERRRAKWFASYLKSTLEKDLRSITEAHKLHRMPSLLRLLATQSANLLVPANIGEKLGLDHRTVESYFDLLESVFLVRRIPAWRPNLGQREIQTAKSYVVDSGVLLHLLGANEARLLEDARITGMAVESFVAMEVLRHAEWSSNEPQVFHYRRGQDEVDLLLEDLSGNIVAIEVKSSASIGKSDWRVLEKLREKLGSRFRHGVVIHTGEQTIPLGDRLTAVPLMGLWS